MKAAPLSPANWNRKVTKGVLEAFEAIHALGVVHGDVRLENVLVEEESSRVWIVDFEFARIISAAQESDLSAEMGAVEQMLKDLEMEGHQHSRCLRPPKISRAASNSLLRAH